MVEKKVLWYKRITTSIITTIENFFYALGKQVATHPKATIITTFITVITCGLGILCFYQEKDPLKLWVPPKSQFVKDSRWLMDTFEQAYREEYILIEADDVLTPKVLQELYELDEKIRTTLTPSGLRWEDVCFMIPKVGREIDFLMKPSKRNRSGVIVEEEFDPSVEMDSDTYCAFIETMEKGCFVRSIFDLWNFRKNKIQSLTKQDIVNAINLRKEDPMFGNLKNYVALLGGITYNETGHIVAAKTLTNVYLALLNFAEVNMAEIGNYAGTSDWASPECLEWEQTFIDISENATKHSENYKLFYGAARSFGDISGETMFGDMGMVIIGGAIMLMYVQFVISKFNCVEARLMLAGAGLMSVGLAVITSSGLCFLFGVFFGPVHTSLPFLLMGLGVDDIFVIMACWEKLNVDRSVPLPERVGLMLKHAGISITVTTVTDVVAFFIGSSTILPCLQSYCIFAAVGVLMTFIYVITFFIACFTYDQMRVEANISGILPWKKYETYKPNQQCQEKISFRIFNWLYSNVILTWPGKLLVIFVTLACLGTSIESLLKLEQKFDPLWFIPEHTYLGQFALKKKEFYPTASFEAGIYMGAANYSYEFTNILEMEEKVYNSTNIINDISSLISPFRQYVIKNYKKDLAVDVASDEEFHTYLSKFLFSFKGARYNANFKFEKDLKCGVPAPAILLSSLDYRFHFFNGPAEHIPAMRQMISIAKDVNFTTGDRFSTAWSKIFATWVTDEVIDVELYRNVQLALICVMFCTLLLIADLQMCFWVFICIILTIVNVGGFMQRWGLTIDLVSVIGITLAIGLCVDYATHIGHTFLTISEGSLHDRALKTVTTIGAAVFCGGTSTLIGVAMLGFSDAYNFQAFFKIFLLVVIFGLFHGIVFLPVMLSWIGPKPYFTHKPVAQTDIGLTVTN